MRGASGESMWSWIMWPAMPSLFTTTKTGFAPMRAAVSTIIGAEPKGVVAEHADTREAIGAGEGRAQGVGRARTPMQPVVPALSRPRFVYEGNMARQIPMIVSPSAVTIASRGSTLR